MLCFVLVSSFFFSHWKYLLRVPLLYCFLLNAILDYQSCLKEFEQKRSVTVKKCLFVFKHEMFFEPRTETGTEHYACQESGLFQVFKLIVYNSEKKLGNTNVEVSRQVKRKQLNSGRLP